MLQEAARKRVEEATAVVEQIPANEVAPDDLDDWLVLDVREDQEFAAGHLPGAVSLPRSRLELQARQTPALEAAAEKPTLVYCGSGGRSLLAAATLKELGALRPVSMDGGYKAWRESGKPVSQD